MSIDATAILGWSTLIVLFYSFINKENKNQLQSVGMVILSLTCLSLVPYMLNESNRILQSIGLILISSLLLYVSIGVMKETFGVRYTSKLIAVTLTVFLSVYTVDFIQQYLITMTARDTVFLLSLTGFEAEIIQNEMGTFINFPSAEEPLKTRIITACTGIGTISVFVGLITSFKQLTARQKILLSFVVGCLIYSLNAFRNFFISASYGYQMLHIAPSVVEIIFGRGDEWVSYYIADRIISQIGSLLFITYLGYILMDRYDSELIDEWKDILSELKAGVTKRKNQVMNVLQAYRQ